MSIPIAGLAWRSVDGGRLEVDILARAQALGGRSISTHPPRYVLPFGTIRPLSPLPIDLEAIASQDMRDWMGEAPDPAILSVLPLLAACWTMMMTPTMAERRSLDARTGQSATPRTPPASDVSIIDLRPLRHVAVDHEESTGRRLTVRHLVRGHWTNQAHGPERSLRRLQWIAPYIKGPAGGLCMQGSQAAPRRLARAAAGLGSN